MADSDVKVPGLGNMNKKTLYIGLAVGAGVLGYAYYRHAKNASASSSGTSSGTSATGTVTDPAGNVCAALDPNSGYCPGTTEDEQYQQDSGAGTSDIDPLTGDIEGSPEDEEALASEGFGTTGTSSTGTTAVTTNVEWEQACIADLQDAGYSTTQITDATNGLGRYLAKLSISGDQITMVQICVGLQGAPPVGGPYSIIQAPTSPTPPAGDVTVPALANGTRVEDANSALSALGLKSTLSETRKPNVAYYVTAQSPKGGTKVAAGSTVKLTISTKP